MIKDNERTVIGLIVTVKISCNGSIHKAGVCFQNKF